MSWLELIGITSLVFAGTGGFLVAAILLSSVKETTKHQDDVPDRDVLTLYLLGKWYAERQEALADEVVRAMGWGHDPSSIEAEICREVVLCGRHPADAKRRLQEVRGMKMKTEGGDS